MIVMMNIVMMNLIVHDGIDKYCDAVLRQNLEWKSGYKSNICGIYSLYEQTYEIVLRSKLVIFCHHLDLLRRNVICLSSQIDLLIVVDAGYDKENLQQKKKTCRFWFQCNPFIFFMLILILVKLRIDIAISWNWYLYG